jgi:hypothetical protein
MIIDALLTEAHHHLGDLLQKVRQGHIIRIVNGTRNQVAGYLVPPGTMDRIAQEMEACRDEEPA